MRDKAKAKALYDEINKRIEPLFHGLTTAEINTALVEVMIDVALTARPDASRLDATEMLGEWLTSSAKDERGRQRH